MLLFLYGLGQLVDLFTKVPVRSRCLQVRQINDSSLVIATILSCSAWDAKLFE